MDHLQYVLDNYDSNSDSDYEIDRDHVIVTAQRNVPKRQEANKALQRIQNELKNKNLSDQEKNL